MQKLLGRNTVVLLGVGHTNAHVLRMWKMNPLENAQLVCISNHPIATYSGMMPGVLAGQYKVEEMEIDLVRLCASAGARLILGEVVGIDSANREIHFRDRPPLLYDALSIGVGSRPTFDGVDLSPNHGDWPASLVPIKPMQTFLGRLSAQIETATRERNSVNISIVGGGIGSIEVAFCLDQRLKSDGQSVGLPKDANYRIQLITGGKTLGSGINDQSIVRVNQECQRRNIEVLTGRRVSRIADSGIELSDGSVIESDLVHLGHQCQGSRDIVQVAV